MAITAVSIGVGLLAGTAVVGDHDDKTRSLVSDVIAAVAVVMLLRRPG